MAQYELQEGLLLAGVVGGDCGLSPRGALLARERRFGIRDVGEDVEEVALFGIDDPLHFGELLVAEALFGQAGQQLLSGVGNAPEGAQFVFVLEEVRQLAEEQLHELLGRHGCAVRVPEGRGHHVLDISLFAVGQADFGSFLPFADAWALATLGTRLFRALAGCLTAYWTRFGIRLYADAGIGIALGARFRLQRLTIPLGIAEVPVGFHEVVDGEVVLAFIEAGAASDDLFELDHGVDGAHQDNVADVAGVHAGRELLGRCQDGRDGLFVVLEVAEVLLAESAVVGGDALAVAGVCAGFSLVDEVAHGECVNLGGAEDQRLFPLIDLVHKELYAVFLAFLDLDDLVEVFLFVQASFFNFAFHHLVIGCVDVLIQRGGNLLDAEGRQEAVVDTFFERVDVDRFAKIRIRVYVFLPLRRGGEAQLHGG